MKISILGLLALISLTSAFATEPSNSPIGTIIRPDLLTSNDFSTDPGGITEETEKNLKHRSIYWNFHLKNNTTKTLYLISASGYQSLSELEAINLAKAEASEERDLLKSIMETKNYIFYSQSDGVCFKKVLKVVERTKTKDGNSLKGHLSISGEMPTKIAVARSFMRDCPESGAIIEP